MCLAQWWDVIVDTTITCWWGLLLSAQVRVLVQVHRGSPSSLNSRKSGWSNVLFNTTVSFASQNNFLEVQVRWGSLADNTPYSLFNTTYYYMNQYYKILRFLLLHNTLSILRNTTLDNTTYYYCVQYCILLHQYYVLLHFPILRITTVDNTTYYYVNTTSILLTILHITTTSNTA